MHKTQWERRNIALRSARGSFPSYGRKVNQFGFFFPSPPRFPQTIDMGEWKVQVSFRIPPDLYRELQEVALRERRTLGSFGRLLIEWAFERHKEVGSSEKLLHCKIQQRKVKLCFSLDASFGGCSSALLRRIGFCFVRFGPRSGGSGLISFSLYIMDTHGAVERRIRQRLEPSADFVKTPYSLRSWRQFLQEEVALFAFAQIKTLIRQALDQHYLATARQSAAKQR